MFCWNKQARVDGTPSKQSFSGTENVQIQFQLNVQRDDKLTNVCLQYSIHTLVYAHMKHECRKTLNLDAVSELPWKPDLEKLF